VAGPPGPPATALLPGPAGAAAAAAPQPPHRAAGATAASHHHTPHNLSALHRTKSGQTSAGVLGGLLDTAITLSSTPVSRPVPSSTPTAVKGACRKHAGCCTCTRVEQDAFDLRGGSGQYCSARRALEWLLSVACQGGG
jgi:hypothetical protein